MSSKRKAESNNTSEKKIKRAGTMEATAKEGEAFLASEAPALSNALAHKDGIETRGKTQTRSAIDDLMNEGKKTRAISEEERKKEEGKLKMVFRLLDKDNDGFLDSDELAGALRSCGKKPLKKKIEKIMKSASHNKKGISVDDFVSYMMKKLFTEKSKEKPPKAAPEKKAKTEKPPPPPKEKVDLAKGEKAPEKAKEKEAPPKQKAASKETVNAPPKLGGRTRSITEFYTEHAGNHEVSAAELDKYSNPKGVEYDLGQEGAFSEFRLLVGSFYSGFRKEVFDQNPGKPLEAKGFRITYTTNKAEFIKELDNVNVAWIISENGNPTGWDDFLQACLKFHESGGGLYIWADNEPYTFQANLLLQKLLNMRLAGNTNGMKVLTNGEPKTAGKFGTHLLTSGIAKLYEGNTICFPQGIIPKEVETVATSSDGNPVVLCVDHGGVKEGAGRIVIDCGFTKLFCEWDTAGTARYVVNSSVWLLGLDARMRLGLPISRFEEVPFTNEEAQKQEEKQDAQMAEAKA